MSLFAGLGFYQDNKYTLQKSNTILAVGLEPDDISGLCEQSNDLYLNYNDPSEVLDAYEALDHPVVLFRFPHLSWQKVQLVADLLIADPGCVIVALAPVSEVSLALRLVNSGMRFVVSDSAPLNQILEFVQEAIKENGRREALVSRSILQAMVCLRQEIRHAVSSMDDILSVMKISCELSRITCREGGSPLEFIDEISESADRAAILSQNLISAISEKQCRSLGSLNASTVVDSMSGWLRWLVNGGIDLTFSCDERVGAIGVSEENLQQIVLNLAINANDAINGEGIILVSVDEFQDKNDGGRRKVEIRVSDSGRSMESTYRTILDSDFSTNKVCVSSRLQIVKSIVGEHGGTVEVSSQTDVGNVISVRFACIS